MTFGSSWSISVQHDCGCQLHVSIPEWSDGMSKELLSAKANDAPPWILVKIQQQISPFTPILFFLLFEICSYYLATIFIPSYNVGLISLLASLTFLFIWANLRLVEVSVLISSPLGIQCSSRYLSGRWKNLSLISTNHIRALHLLDHVTNTSVQSYLAVEVFVPTAIHEVPFPGSSDHDFRLQPLFQTVFCLPLSTLTVVYRLGIGVLFPSVK